MGENAFWMREIRGEWAVWFKLTERPSSLQTLDEDFGKPVPPVTSHSG